MVFQRYFGMELGEIIKRHLKGEPCDAACSSTRQRGIMDPLVWTNLLYYLCALTYYVKGYELQTFFIIISATSSFLYHRSYETCYSNLDRGLAIGVFLYSLGYVPLMDWPGRILLALLVASAFHIWAGCGEPGSSSYSTRHSLWHVMVFLGQALVSCTIPVVAPNAAIPPTLVYRR